MRKLSGRTHVVGYVDWQCGWQSRMAVNLTVSSVFNSRLLGSFRQWVAFLRRSLLDSNRSSLLVTSEQWSPPVTCWWALKNHSRHSFLVDNAKESGLQVDKI